jgi:hypothetical protein
MKLKNALGRTAAGAWSADRPLGDEGFFLRPRPGFELPFTLQRIAQRLVAFGIDERHGTPARCVLGASAGVVDDLALVRIARVARVQRPVRTSDHVDEVRGRPGLLQYS